ncbi:hypothetical protein [Pedobacter endophyticus]|uniref:Outer membrane protein beta-barrel domain-containing protein n=1 Tax=Pedobacter endophyticus TaxID=2789740 RepID=A0A7S9Q084_9SPHI|nr:hypothetical protein [Pedobacter endophyticus]QPH41373.1 hypothetical protein IZT61_09010 [Pedobacter endophyticus]
MKFKNAIKTIMGLAICFGATLTTHAQDSTSMAEKPNEVTSFNKIRLNLLGLGYEREQKIGRLTTFYIGAGVESSLIYRTESELRPIVNSDGSLDYAFDEKSTTEFKLYPSFNTGLRHYFNFERRIKKGKNTVNNAAGYVGFDVLAIFPTQKNEVDYQINMGPRWGFQTHVGKKINFGLDLGPDVTINSEEVNVGLGGKLGFSYLF